eukprot:1183093-Amphidinium_carterae.1
MSWSAAEALHDSSQSCIQRIVAFDEAETRHSDNAANPMWESMVCFCVQVFEVIGLMVHEVATEVQS